jgi:hypothetical protein
MLWFNSSVMILMLPTITARSRKDQKALSHISLVWHLCSDAKPEKRHQLLCYALRNTHPLLCDVACTPDKGIERVEAHEHAQGQEYQGDQLHQMP